MRSEAAFAHLAGVAPIPASSGRTHHHRLNRGGDRAANNPPHTIVLVRMRCLRRFVAREVYRALTSTSTEQITQADLAPAA